MIKKLTNGKTKKFKRRHIDDRIAYSCSAACLKACASTQALEADLYSSHIAVG